MKNKEAFIGIAILNYNSADALAVTLDSLARMKTDVRFVCSVLDNASTDCEEAREVFASFQKKKPEFAGEFVASSKNLGFSGGNNVLIQKFLEGEQTSHILLANSDLSFTDYSIDRMLALGVDAVGPVTGRAGNTQTIETNLDLPMSVNSLSRINVFSEKRYRVFGTTKTEVPMLVFFCVLLSRKLVEQVGLLDERFYPGSYEDDDYCVRMTECGYKLYCARGVFICHWGSRSFSKLEFSQRKQVGDDNRTRFEEKWKKPWVSRAADPLVSCGQDVEHLLGKVDDGLADGIRQGFLTSARLIVEQDAAIRFYQTKLESLQNTLPAPQVQPDSSAEQIYLMTPIRRGIPQVPGKILIKQILYKMKNRITRILLWRKGTALNCIVPNMKWDGFEEVYFMEACAQLIERVAFKLSRPLHRKSEKKERRTSAVSSTIQTNPVLEHDAQSLDELLLCVLNGKWPAVALLSPYPSDEFLRDGYYKRIRNIDDLFSSDYFRIYVCQYDNVIPEPRVISHGEKAVEIQYNVCNEEHIRRIAEIVNHCAFMYTHSVLRINTLLLDQIQIPKILDLHGSVPEEAHLYSNYAGERIYGEWEQYAIVTYDTFVFVTDAMRLHMEQKYRKKLTHSIILPTYDQSILHSIAQRQGSPERVSEYTVVYSGGTQKWQRMDLIFQAMQKRGDLNYLVLTPDTDIVREACEKQKFAKNVQIKSVSPEVISREYQKCQYGFILRDDIVVNHVACPTKLMEYLAYEIIPIMYTPNIGDFVSLGMQYVPYTDFVEGKLPSEEARIAMVQHNLQVARKFADIYEKGERALLTCGREFLLKANGFPQQEPEKKDAVGLVVGSFDKGGLEQAVFNLYEGYRANGHDTYILCQNDLVGHFADKLASSEHLCIFNNDTVQFFAFCREKNIRWLHYHYNTFMIRQARVMGLRTIYSLQNVYTWLSDQEICERAELINSAHAVVAGSTFSKDYYCARTGTPGKKVSVIPIGVNTEGLDSHSMNPAVTRESLEIKQGEITLGFIASFHQVKHQMNMVGAMEQIVRKNQKIKLLFVANIGHPDYYRAVYEASKNSTANENIIFVPFIDHTQLGEFLRQTVDIFILPTIQEGCSNAVIDALYVGKPMLLTDVGNAGDLRHLESVTVVGRPYKDLLSFRQSDIDDLCMKKNCINTSEIADQILSIADDLKSQNQAAKRAAEEYRDRCDKRYMAERYLDIIETL